MVMTKIVLLLSSIWPGAEIAPPPTPPPDELHLVTTMPALKVSPQWALTYGPTISLSDQPIDLESATAEAVAEALSMMYLNSSDGFEVGERFSDADLALYWGVAHIGPGVLFPQGFRTRGGSPGIPLQRGGDRGGFFLPEAGQIPQDPGDGPKVPEPASLLLWIAGAAAVWSLRRQGRHCADPPVKRT